MPDGGGPGRIGTLGASSSALTDWSKNMSVIDAVYRAAGPQIRELS